MSYKKKDEQRKELKEYLSIADKRVLDIRKSGIELAANDEIFVLVNGTNNYWISNYGRLVNNLRGSFYMHKTGYAHYTLSGIDSKIETYTDRLVAEHFLEKTDRYNKIWHVDRDRNNAFVNSYLEKKEAERKAEEEKRLAAEREQSLYNSIRRMIDIRDKASEKIAQTSAMLQSDEQRRKEHEAKMEWYRKQSRK